METSIEVDNEEEKQIYQDFKFIKQIGEGAFGKVWKCIKIADNTECAIKVNSKGFSIIEQIQIVLKSKLSKKKVQQQKECLIQASIKNDYIVQFHDVRETPAQIFIIMEYIRNKTLQRWFELNTNSQIYFTEEQSSIIIKQILLAINSLHQKNIIHRDLKPENLLVKSFNPIHIKLSDFGLSTQYENLNDNWLSHQCGTLIYMAPEFCNQSYYTC